MTQALYAHMNNKRKMKKKKRPTWAMKQYYVSKQLKHLKKICLKKKKKRNVNRRYSKRRINIKRG
jgi:hypothetical protein